MAILSTHAPSSRRHFVLGAAGTLALAACGRSSRRRSPEGAPQRIASRTVLADELLWAFGPTLHPRVVALSPMADDPRYSLVAGRWPEATPRLGRNPEELLAQAPDLVILASFSDAEYRAAIERSVELLVLDDFTGFEGFLRNLERIGAACGAGDQADSIANKFRTRRQRLEARRPPKGARPSIAAWDFGYSPGADTSFDDAASSAGFLNLPARAGLSGHQRLDSEQLIAWDPEYLVIGCGELGCGEALSQLEARPGLSKLRALRERQVITVEAPYLATTGEGMLELAARLQARLLRDPAVPA